MQKFINEYRIRSYECDKNGYLRIVTLMNILQDMADSHAALLGLGLDFCLKNGLAWVGAHYHLQIERLPQVHETVKIMTWPAEKKKLGAVRDFVVYDADEKPIIRASSLWILIDFVRKKPVIFDKIAIDYHPLDERALNSDFVKLPPVENPEFHRCFEVRFDDIDFNNHVNNAVYPLWAVETTDNAYRLNHIPAEIEISYKKECHLGEKVIVTCHQDENIALYNIKTTEDERELAHLRIKWRKI